MVQAKGVEPLILAAEASKTPMYASSNTPGYIKHTYLYWHRYYPLGLNDNSDKEFGDCPNHYRDDCHFCDEVPMEVLHLTTLKFHIIHNNFV